VDRALADAGIGLTQLDAVTVTAGPGLVGALLVGVMYGKGLAFSLDRPLLGVNHLEGHLFAPTLEDPGLEPPFVALLVSGGHTLLLDVVAWGDYRLLGQTLDDAAGEAFDKVANLLGLGYPGGAAVERLAREGRPDRFRFPRPMLQELERDGPGRYAFSFSGLKTAVRNAAHAAARRGADLERERPHLARAFQDALIESLAEKTVRAARDRGRARVVLGGGVACNRTLQAAMRERLGEIGAAVYAPTPRLATDNAAMIARAGLFHYERGERAPLDLDAYASLPIPGLAPA
jgi:N6-L-threonylcarbamoyladenine synthase